MLPPVSATTTTLLDYPSSVPQPIVRPQLTAANDMADDGMSSERLLSGGRREAMSLSGQLQLAQGASVFAETIGQLLQMPRGENESLAAYAARITEAVKALSPGEKLALQRLLNQVVNGLTLRLLAEVLKNPSGPGAARLALHMEMTQLSDHDLPTEAAVTSYRQTAGVQPVQTVCETAPVIRLASANHGNDNPPLELAGTDAEAQAAARPVAGSKRTELSGRTTAIPIASAMSPGSVTGQAAGPAPATVLASPDDNPDASPDTEATSASDKQPLPAADIEGPVATGRVAGETRTKPSGRTTAIPTASSMSPGSVISPGSVTGQAAGPALSAAAGLASPQIDPDAGAASPNNPRPMPAPGEGPAATGRAAGIAGTELSGKTTAIPTAPSLSPASVTAQAAGPALATVLASPWTDPDASPDTEATSASDKQPLPAPLADPLKARAAATADATAAGEWNRASHPASPPPPVHSHPAAAMWSEAEPKSMSGYSSGPGPQSGATASTAADGEAADGDAAVSEPHPSRPATVQAAGPLAVPDVQAAATGSDIISPMEAGTRLPADGKGAAVGLATSPSVETSRASMLPETDVQPPAELDMASDADAVYRPARPATAESILVITQGLVKAFSGHALAEALTPLLSLSSLPGEFEPAPDGTQTMSKADQPHESFEGPNGTAAKMASPQQLVDEATLATKQASAAARAGQPAAEAADMQEQLQLALPLILPRDGMPLPYLTYPPTEQEPKREERKVREIAEVDEDGDGQQHPSGGHRPQDGDEDGEAEEAPVDAADLEIGHAADDGRANDLYWRMAGWS
jgi:hypothetical protein